MLVKMKFLSVILAYVCITVEPMTNVFTITLEVARPTGITGSTGN
jgi:hypothetical protein